jgi:HEAT repeat protein
MDNYMISRSIVPIMLTALPWSKSQKANARDRQSPGAELSVEHAIEMLRTPPDRPAIAVPVIDALAGAGDPRAVEPLIAVLKSSKNLTIKEHVIDALGRLGDPRAVEPLIAKLQDRSDDFYIRKKAARTLYVIYRQGRLDPEQREKVLSHWHAWYLL